MSRSFWFIICRSIMRLDDPGLVGLPIARPRDNSSFILEFLPLHVQTKSRSIRHSYVESPALSIAIARLYLPTLRVIVYSIIQPALVSRLVPVIRWLQCPVFVVEDVVCAWAVLVGLEFPHLVVTAMETVEDETASVQETLTAVKAKLLIIT